MEIRKITPAGFKESRWSGGSTTELAIHPPEALYAQRAFDFRLSSAVVEDDHSVFTPLPDYHRIIAPIDGPLTLSFGEARPPVTLGPLDCLSFEGAWPTQSRGKAKDLNLMLRHGVCTGDMMALTLSSAAELSLPAGAPAHNSGQVWLLWCASGSAVLNLGDSSTTLSEGELIRLDLAPARARWAPGSVIPARLQAGLCWPG